MAIGGSIAIPHNPMVSTERVVPVTDNASKNWQTLKQDRQARIMAAERLVKTGKIVDAADAVALLETVIRPFDKVNIEGDNQKQADFLAQCLSKADTAKIHDLHMVQSVIALDSHLDIFEKGIAKKLDFSFSGPQAGRLAKFIREKRLELGAIHTYLELYGRYYTDLTPRVCMLAAYQADRHGNLYTGFNTEDSPVVAEATKFKQGIVIAQVNEIVDQLPRVDIPADWVDFVVQSPNPFSILSAKVLKGFSASTPHSTILRITNE